MPVSHRVEAYLQTLARRGVPKESNKAGGVDYLLLWKWVPVCT